ncbi:MAG TPA: hypothetical protein PKE45_25920, partial [Caldilineaceae bacterium]|nr:hypothetical protein [Caldilineaceae bacterium]
TTDSVPIPWVVFAEETAGASAIRVLKLDIGIAADASDDRFIPVGNNINSQCLGRAGQSGQGGSDPDIFFVGHVIHVAWVEQQNGVGKLFVCHLADARPGQERWDLDSDYPINRQVGAPASSASLSSNGDTPYLAWQEGSAASNVYVAHRYPAEPAWGRNYPPFIRTISWSREVLVTDLNVTGAIDQAIREMVTKEFVLTTSCYHAEGWEHIQEIQFKIANDELTAFLGKYVAAEDKLYVANADGEFTAPGFTPGSGQQYVTDNVILNTAKTLPRSHGDHSPVLDIDWVMSFRTPTKNQDLLQQINIVYDDGRETGFFQTGLLSFDYRVYMPNVAN